MPGPYISRLGELSSSENYAQFTFAGAAIDLTTVANGAPMAGLPTRRIKFNMDGALTVTRKDGTNVTLLNRKQGEVEEIDAVAVVVAGTTALLVFTCYW